MDIKQQVADKVRQAINDKDQSISSTAELTGISYTQLHRKLNGLYEFTMTELGLLADALEVHPAELMPDEFAQEEAV